MTEETMPFDHARASRGQFGLEWSLLAYSLIITLMITLAPFRFQWPSASRLLLTGPMFDIVTNVLLFMPLGFLYWLTREPFKGSRLVRVFLLGCVVSGGIEVTQLFLPGRYTSPSDILANAGGAWLGAMLCARAQRLLNRQWIGRLGLELPLMNIVYLLVPLIWMDGLSAGGDPSRLRLSWVLGICGSVVIGGVYRYGIIQPRILKLKALLLVSACWFAASSLPAFALSASAPLYGSAIVAVAVSCLVRLPLFRGSDRRRFEIPVLKRVWPLYGAYLVALSLWPLPARLSGWRGAWGFADLADDPSITAILRLIEAFAAFTLLGYMVAESYGRREASQGVSILWSCFWCGFAAAFLEVCRGFHPHYTASFNVGLLMFLGGAFGASIYWRQLSSIQRLLRNPEENGAGRVVLTPVLPEALSRS